MSDTTSRPITLELTSVTVRFGGLLALHDVSFRVYENEIVGLIGPNGAGKTTAFNVACGFQKPTSGSVHFPASGHDARELFAKRDSRSSRMGRTPKAEVPCRVARRAAALSGQDESRVWPCLPHHLSPT